MNVITAPARLTPDDLLRMGSEGKGYELVDGELRGLNVSAKSSRVAGLVHNRLENYCSAHHPGWVFPEGTSFQCFRDDPNRVRRADASHIALDRFTAGQYDTAGHIPVVPDLVVEVISPNDLANDVNEKIGEWLVAGVRLLWVIDPEVRTVQVFRAGEATTTLLYDRDTLTGDPVLPGFSCPVADLFRLPAAPTP
jgi:Uma2 family endonuclease